MIRMNIGIIATLAVLLSASATQAAINPEEFRKVAPEGVVIEVVASRVEEADKMTRVYLAARIVEVVWSATGLEAGDLILIAYLQDHKQLKKDRVAMEKRLKKGWVGPQVMYFPPVLEAGTVHMAHLGLVEDEQSTGQVYSPQAYQYSFERESLKERLERLEK